MKTRKSFAAPPPVEVVTDPQALLDDAASLVISLPENQSGRRTIDLTPWLGKGIDAWVWACAGQLRAFLASAEVAVSTVANYWGNGLCWFFTFLTTGGGPADPAQLELRHIRLYLCWLAEQGWGYSTQKKSTTPSSPFSRPSPGARSCPGKRVCSPSIHFPVAKVE